MLKSYIRSTIAYLVFLFLLWLLSRYFLLDLSGKSIGVIFIVIVLVGVFRYKWLEKARGKVLVFTITTFLMVFGGDLLLRKMMADQIYYRPEDRFGNSYPNSPDFLERFIANVNFEGQSSGDIATVSGNRDKTTPRNVKFITDELGFRNIPGQKDMANDLILLGDSYGAGTGNDQDSSAAGILKNKYGHTLYNLCYPGADPLQELVNISLEYPKIKKSEKPVLVWLLFTGNDFSGIINAQWKLYLDGVKKQDHSAFYTDSWAAVQRAKFRTFINRSPIRQIVKGITSDKKNAESSSYISLEGERNIFFSDAYLNNMALKLDEIESKSNSEIFKETIKTAKWFAEANQIDLKFAIIPCKYEIYGWMIRNEAEWSGTSEKSDMYKYFENVLKENEMPYIDLYPIMLGKARNYFRQNKQILYWDDDTHFNPLGHKIMADAIENFLHPQSSDTIHTDSTVNSPVEFE